RLHASSKRDWSSDVCSSDLVISVSQSMRIVALYAGDERYVLEDTDVILSRANQALATLERYKARLDEVTRTLSALEIEDLVTVRDVAAVVQRLEMVRRISEEIETYILELGTDGRLLQLQLDELIGGIGPDRELIIDDYLPARMDQARSVAILNNLANLDSLALVDLNQLAKVLEVSGVHENLDTAVAPRGYRLLHKIPRLP